jgi:hypothetical protein
VSDEPKDIIKQCDGCKDSKHRHFFHSHEWRKSGVRLCMGCVEKRDGLKSRWGGGEAWRGTFLSGEGMQ